MTLSPILKPPLELLDYLAFALCIVLLMHYGIVERGSNFWPRDSISVTPMRERMSLELGHYHLGRPCGRPPVAGGLLQGPRQVVVDGQELRYRVGAHILIYASRSLALRLR